MTFDEVKALKIGSYVGLDRRGKILEARFLGIAWPPHGAPPKNAKISLDGQDRLVPFRWLVKIKRGSQS